MTTRVQALKDGNEVVVVPSKDREEYDSAIFYADIFGNMYSWSRELGEVEWTRGDDELEAHFAKMEWLGNFVFVRGRPKYKSSRK